MEIEDIKTDDNENKVIVEYVERNDFGKFKTIQETFELHEDGDPLFVLPSDKYKKMIHSTHEKEMWKIITTEGMQRWIMHNPGKDIWFVDEATGNSYKYLMPDKK